MPSYTIGLDYGTGSVRAILVSTTGEEVAAHVYDYPHGAASVVISERDPNLARQHPRDYETGAEAAVKGVLKEGAEKKGVRPEEIIGIGVDTTGSTPLPVDAHGIPLAYDKRFENDPNAMAWLWKDHTSHAEAEQITNVGGKMHPEYLAKIGNRYSSEWFWAKILHCARVAPTVFDAAATWVEIADWIPAMLCDTLKPSQLKRCVCAAGHKAFYQRALGRLSRCRISESARSSLGESSQVASRQGIHRRRSGGHAFRRVGQAHGFKSRHTCGGRSL